MLDPQPKRKEILLWHPPPHPRACLPSSATPSREPSQSSASPGVALIHLLDSPGTFDEQAYKGWLYLGLIAGSILTDAALIRSSDSRAWLAAALLALGALVGFVISRTVGLPGGADDIGNWSEPLGLASLFVESSVVALAGAVLSARLPATSPRRTLAAVAAR